MRVLSMSYNKKYSKNFGTVLMILGLAILFAFSSVATFFTGAAFYRGVFLMSEAVIKPKADQATAAAA